MRKNHMFDTEPRDDTLLSDNDVSVKEPTYIREPVYDGPDDYRVTHPVPVSEIKCGGFDDERKIKEKSNRTTTT